MFPGKIGTMIKMIEFLDVPFVKIDRRLCSYLRLVDSCSKCIDICPVDAIEINSDIFIDERSCVKCGACAVACDNGVIKMLDISDEGIISKIIKYSTKFDSIAFECDGCNNNFKIRHKNIPKDIAKIILPCLGRINENILLNINEAEFTDVYFSECNDNCTFKKARTGFDKSNVLASHLVNCIKYKPEQNMKGNGQLNQSSESHIYERRYFLFESGKKVARIALNREKKEEKSKGYQDTRINPRRIVLFNFLDNYSINDYIINQEGIPFADLEVNDTCNMCGLCTRICPTEALWTYDTEEQSNLIFDFSKCVGCGLCEIVCDKSSIKIGLNVNLGNLQKKPRKVQSVSLANCNRCGKGFTTNFEGDFCQNCIKHNSIISDFTKSKNLN